ncbi:hypothetical protein [Micromonospora rifamycinica]|uniref:hypothetical protein n=1 Tax=Micromonospora rifamycinica TaxID=291594 RepID=UPI0012F74976|nr:hypothetical protein [Micromonospora rifamycinica]
MPEADGDDLNELTVLLKVLDILRLRIEAQEPRNNEAVQITQIVSQFLPGTTIGNLIQGHGTDYREEVIMGDKYEVRDNAQVGAMGKRAQVTTVTFGSAQGDATEVDLKTLASELKSLRAEMRNRAETTDEDLAVVSIGQAISAAEKGEDRELFRHLKSSGQWALGLATSIGAGVAAGAIKSSLGL